MATVPLNTKAIGSIVKIRENGALVDYIVAQHGSPSADYVGFDEGTLLLRKDVYSKTKWNSSNNYAASTVHSQLNDDSAGFLSLLDQDIKERIQYVKIPYRPGSGSSESVSSGDSGLYCRVFIPSFNEMGLKPNTEVGPNIGTALSLYVDSSNSDRIAYYNGSASSYFTRTPGWYYPTTGAGLQRGNSIYIIKEDGDGKITYYSNTSGVRPSFVLGPSASVYVTDTGEVTNNAPPEISSPAGESGVNFGTKSEPFQFQYTPGDANSDSLTITEKLDGVTTKTRGGVASGTSLIFEYASVASEFQKILNGSHTITLEANDGKETAVFTASFEKAVHSATITLAQPLAVAGNITAAAIAMTGFIPEDAIFRVEATNNGLDSQPVWQDVTAEVRDGVNIVFANHANNNGAAFNFRITVQRGSSGTGGYISGVSGAFQ